MKLSTWIGLLALPVLPAEAGAQALDWKVGPALPEPISNAAVTKTDDRLFVIGGSASDGTEESACWESDVGTLGTLSAWNPAGDLNLPRTIPTAHENGGLLYSVLGVSDQPVTSVEWARPDPTGVLHWQLQSGLFLDRLGHASWLHGGRLYVAGGNGDVSVESAPILSDGSVGASRPETTLPGSRVSPRAVILDGHVFLAGGFSIQAGEIWSSRILPDGTLDPWVVAGGCPGGNGYFNVLTWQDRMLLVGDGEVWMHQPIAATPGALEGIWVDLGSLPGGLDSGSAAIVHGSILYLIGGQTDQTVDEVWYADLEGRLAPPTTYCSAKITSSGLTPAIDFTGSPTLGGPDDFRIIALGVPVGEPGFLFWGAQPAKVPFHGGFRCVQPPLMRTAVQVSVPAGPLGGLYSYHLSKTYLTGAGLQVGDIFFAQYWGRDPGFAPPDAISLTDGLMVTVLP